MSNIQLTAYGTMKHSLALPVVLTAILSNSSVGTVTTNCYYGIFSYHWTPAKANTYAITASFAGDGSYGSSSGATAFSAGAVVTSSPVPTQSPPSSNVATAADLMTWILISAVAIIIAVAIATVLMLRKH